MTRNIFVLIVCLIGLSLSTSLAQDGSDYKGMKFEAHPKHQSEIGISPGLFVILGDIDPKPGWGVGLHFRRAFDYAFAWRIDAMYGMTTGLEGRNSHSSTEKNDVLNGEMNPNLNYFSNQNPALNTWYHNYQTKYMSLTFQGIWSLNSFNFKQQTRKSNIYLLGGAGANSYKTYYDALDGGRNGMQYDFSSVNPNNELGDTRADRKTAKDRVKAILDGDYETRAEIATGRHKDNDPESFRINFHANAGVGVSFKISESFNIAVEQQVTFVFGNDGDLLDGYQWNGNTLTRNNDLVSFTSLRLNFNIGKKESRSEPLWWVSPLSLMAEDLAEVKARPVFDTTDSDGDGVVDMFDQEPDTPEGYPVDTKGVQLDSDGDGIPDGIDREPYSPPGYNVDADGIAQVPTPEYAQIDDVNRIVDSKINEYVTKSGEAGSDWWLPMIHYDIDRYDIKASEFGKLRSIADVMKNYPNKRIVVVGHTDRSANSCYNDVLSYNRAEAAINYLVSKYDLDRNRFVLNWSGENDNLVDTDRANLWNRRVEFRVATNEVDEERPDCRKDAGKGKGAGYSGNKEAGY